MKICALPHRVWHPKMEVSSTSSIGRDALDLPRRWREPSHVFTMPGRDLLELSPAFVLSVFAVMTEVDRHHYQLATAHPDRAASLDVVWGSHIWLGALVDEATAVERLTALRASPAKVKFAHIQARGAIPLIDPAGLAFVVVEAAGEPEGLTALDKICDTSRVRLFHGPRVADAELRRPASSSTLGTLVPSRSRRLRRG